jgi:hypothetical protein
LTEGVFAAHFISSKNGKAAAGENAPAAVPPATMPVLELRCESVENTPERKLALCDPGGSAA